MVYSYEHYGTQGSFGKALFDAIRLADYKNLEKLRLGFPEEVKQFEEATGRRKPVTTIGALCPTCGPSAVGTKV